MRKEEQKIIEQLKQGNNAAYKYLYDQYYVLLCSIAYEFLKDYFLAQTIVDDLILNLWQKRENLEISFLRSYLVRAVRNRCINHLNLEHERKEIAFSLVNPDDKERISHSEGFEYPLGILMENELEEKINQAIERLPEDCRQVFKLSRFENKRYDEIAETLNISVNTVKYHMKNALSRLHKDLSHYLTLFFYCLLSFFAEK